MKIIVALRHKERSTAQQEKDFRAATRRLAKLRTSVEQMRAKLTRDLRSSDPSRFLTALAVAMLDETGIDPITAKKKHVRFGEDDDLTSVMFKVNRTSKATISAPHIVKALRNAYEVIDDDDDELFRHPTGQVTADSVAEYLTKFGLTSEKLRGFNANRFIQTKLTSLRAKGGELPRHGMSKRKVLRGEFEQALSATASSVGLDPNLLRTKYLAPGLEASYLRDGTFHMKEANLQAVSVYLRALGE